MPSLSTIQMLGIAGMLSYATARFAARAGMLGYNRYMLVAVPVSGMPAMPRGFGVEEMSADRLAKHQIDVSSEVQAKRFAQGLVCLGAFNAKGNLIGVNWVGTRPFVEDEVHVRFSVPDDAGWDTGLWIHPEHRLGRGFSALWAGTAHWLGAHGRRWSMSRIADYNLPSILSHKRMSAVKIGQLTVFRLFQWQYVVQCKPRITHVTQSAPAQLNVGSLTIPLAKIG